MARRITRANTRAKQSIKDSGALFHMPAASDFEDHLRVVLHVLYLIFNEGMPRRLGQICTGRICHRRQFRCGVWCISCRRRTPK